MFRVDSVVHRILSAIQKFDWNVIQQHCSHSEQYTIKWIYYWKWDMKMDDLLWRRPIAVC
jgi:hypothetical protein